MLLQERPAPSPRGHGPTSVEPLLAPSPTRGAGEGHTLALRALPTVDQGLEGRLLLGPGLPSLLPS